MISVDVKDGKVMSRGWQDTVDIDAFGFITDLELRGIRQLMVTDITRDGTLEGTRLELYDSLRKQFPQMYLLAAGGVGCIEDLQDLRDAQINGAIFGKAFYEEKISLVELNQFNNAG